MKTRTKYGNLYKTFIESRHTCKCGCGRVLQPSYKDFCTILKKTGRYPEYLKGHKGKKRERTVGIVDHNGCKILLLNYPERCKRGFRCEKYMDCLSYVAKIGANGWRTA